MSTSDYSKALRAVVSSAGGSRSAWRSVDGPETGVGVEYWFEHRDRGTWYVCVDQGEVTACSQQGDSDG